MSAPPLRTRFLLDHNFPRPVVDLSTVDATVEVVALDDFDRSLTRRGTPDWLIYLRAAEGGFHAVVTRDRSQLDEPEELTALMLSGMNVITWREPIEDPIQEWGQLLAYLGLIRARLAGKRGMVVQLPRPSLSKAQVQVARALIGKMASETGMSFPQIRDEARRSMQADLTARRMNQLHDLLEPNSASNDDT